MFEINNKEVETYEIQQQEFHVIKDFYKYPDQIVEYITSVEPVWHRHAPGFFHQGIDFEDKRHYLFSEDIEPVYNFLESITKQRTCDTEGLYKKNLVSTNYTKFLNNKFQNKLFHPHTDSGKTALVYLNKGKSKGTNFYSYVDFEVGTEHKEHFYPKNKAKVLHNIESEYNKLIIWNGALQYHGMCMDKKWLDEWRINQVFFFQQ